MYVFVVSANTTFRKLYIQWSSINVYAVFGHNQVEFTTAYMEKNPDVEAPPPFHCERGHEGGTSTSVFFSTYAAVKSTRQ